MTTFPPPGSDASTIEVKTRYDNFIGGQWVAPVDGRYFENITPLTGKQFCEIARRHPDNPEPAEAVAEPETAPAAIAVAAT